MAGLCEGGNEPPGSLKASGSSIDGIYSLPTIIITLFAPPCYGRCSQSLMLAGNEFQSLGRAIVKEDEYEEVRWDGIVSIVSWRERVFRLWWEERLSKDELAVFRGRSNHQVLLDRGEWTRGRNVNYSVDAIRRQEQYKWRSGLQDSTGLGRVIPVPFLP
ncbi:hypothetical protein ANN_13319 [Periplaneta americana]|uniref:Uncharacterized protein n=1 Tax=Periplaneta americana TaxID=6978 RepID=A0ABQ8TJI9_PERAM|nr:hypothetical protein ANN_13319 [Periplaneta americana]